MQHPQNNLLKIPYPSPLASSLRHAHAWDFKKIILFLLEVPSEKLFSTYNSKFFNFSIIGATDSSLISSGLIFE